MTTTKKLNIEISPPPEALCLLQTLGNNGFETYFCGGCVRDSLLGKSPKDWDLATSALPEQVEGIFTKTVPVGKKFGVILVLAGENKYEVATFRADSPESDGRRPQKINFSRAEEDVKRRDFTINGLLYEPKTDKLLDFVGGIPDLKQQLIRAIGKPEKRFQEDHLRLLRAVRFASLPGFKLEKNTDKALCELAELTKKISVERVADELDKMLTSGQAGRAFTLLAKSGILKHILPEVAALRALAQPPQFHPEGDVLTHTLMLLDCLPKGCSLILAWAALLHDIGKAKTFIKTDRIRFPGHENIGAKMAEQLLGRLHCAKDFTKQVVELIKQHMRIASLPDMRLGKLRRFLNEPMFALHLELHRLDCLCSHGKLGVYDFAKAAYAKEQNKPPEIKALLSGHDLIALGYRPGPEFKVILEAVEDARLENRLTNKDEARQFVKKHFP